MMNHLNNSGIDKLILDSYAALKSGDKEKARVFAQKAAKLSPNSEQAWLILAALSRSNQALYYLENALRANPDSKAARKGIRVIFEQMAAQAEKTEAVRQKLPQGSWGKEPQTTLDDTSPIPVQPERKTATEGTSEETPEKAAQKEPEEQTEDKIQVTSIISRSQLKKILRKKKEPIPETTPSSGQSADEKIELLRRKLSKPAAAEDKPPSEEEPTRKIRFKKVAKKKIEETILPVDIPIVEKEPDEAIPQPIPQKTRGKTSADSVDSPIPSGKIPAPTLADNLTRAFSKNEEEIDRSADWQPDHNIVVKEAAEPLEETSVVKIINQTKDEIEKVEKSPLNKTFKEPKEKKKPKAKQPVKTKKVLTSGDVDIIEVVLISLAAIMLPLLTFLYFYLKN